MKNKFQFLFLIFAIGIFCSGSFAQVNPADQVLGLWWTPKKDGRIEIVKKNDQFYGRIVWSIPEKENRLDIKNPDKSRHSQKIMGMEILKDFKFDGEKWVGGTIYDPNNGKTYSCKMSLEGSQLRVRGYIGISLLGRTETFER